MTYYADERIDIAAGETAQLDSALLDNVGGSKANTAVIENGTTANSAVLYRFGSAPVLSPESGHRLDPGERAEITGFENIRDLVLLGAGSVASSVFVSFGT